MTMVFYAIACDTVRPPAIVFVTTAAAATTAYSDEVLRQLLQHVELGLSAISSSS